VLLVELLELLELLQMLEKRKVLLLVCWVKLSQKKSNGLGGVSPQVFINYTRTV